MARYHCGLQRGSVPRVLTFYFAVLFVGTFSCILDGVLTILPVASRRDCDLCCDRSRRLLTVTPC